MGFCGPTDQTAEMVWSDIVCNLTRETISYLFEAFIHSMILAVRKGASLLEGSIVISSFLKV